MITEVNLSDRWGWFNIETDDWCLHGFPLSMTYTDSERVFDRKSRKFIKKSVEKSVNYYEWETETGFAFRYTQFPIVLNHYLKLGLLTVDQYKSYIKELDLPEFDGVDLPSKLGPMEMRDEQMDILTKLMTKRFGLCHVYTGFGKTEMIAYMCYYYKYILGWRVLVTSPNAKVLDEIVDRINSRLGIKVGVNYPNDSGILAINAGSVSKQKYNHYTPEYQEYLSKVDVILADEVEACLTPTHHQIYDICKGRKCMYGFSATPDCYCGKLDIYEGVTQSAFRSKHLLDTFGGTLIGLTPSNFDISVIEINVDWWYMKDKKLLDLKDTWINSEFDWSIFPEGYRIMLDNDIFMQPEFANLLGKLSQEYPNLVITINRTEIIDYWVSQLPHLKIIEISGRGYRYRYEGEIRQLSKDELKSCYLTADLLLGSKSFMRGVDLPELKNSIQLSGKKAGSTIQSIGRTARKRSMNILLIVPKRYIPGYSNNNESRKNLILTQYPKELNNVRFEVNNKYR